MSPGGRAAGGTGLGQSVRGAVCWGEPSRKGDEGASPKGALDPIPLCRAVHRVSLPGHLAHDDTREIADLPGNSPVLRPIRPLAVPTPPWRPDGKAENFCADRAASCDPSGKARPKTMGDFHGIVGSRAGKAPARWAEWGGFARLFTGSGRLQGSGLRFGSGPGRCGIADGAGRRGGWRSRGLGRPGWRRSRRQGR